MTDSPITHLHVQDHFGAPFPTDLLDQLERAFPAMSWCCYRSASLGVQACTCWVPLFDREQQPEVVGHVGSVGDDMCPDCAYRPGSPERATQPGFLEDLVADGSPFYCHQGIRRVIGWTHPASGPIVWPAGAGDYRPPMVVRAGMRVPLRADGTVADLCHGWCSRRLRAMQAGPADA